MRSSTKIFLYRHISLQIGALKFFGIWFYMSHSIKSLRFWIDILVKIFIGLSVFIIPTAGQVFYLIRLVLNGNADIQEVVGILNLVLTELLVSFKLLDLYLHRDLLSDLMEQLYSEQFNSSSEPHQIILGRAVKVSRWLFLGLFVSSALDVVVHAVVVPAVHGFQTLPLKMDLIFFDVNDELYFKYVCIYQILYKPIMVTGFATLQSLPWAAMLCAISQLDVLIYNIENMKELVNVTSTERHCSRNDAFKVIFKECVLHHFSIIRFIRTLQGTFGGQLSSNLFLSAFIICSTAMQFISIETHINNITEIFWVLVYLSVIVVMLFLDCYIGDKITTKSSYIPIALFASPWINLTTDLKKNIVIFIAMTQRPAVITSVKLVSVSLETFTKVMNWTYKGFAVMNHMKSK